MLNAISPGGVRFSKWLCSPALLLSNPAVTPQTVPAPVGTNQVAPTILRALGLDTRLLGGVWLEGTAVLPDVNLNLNR